MDEAIAVCGFSREEITDPSKKTEAQITQEFFDWLLQADDHTTAGQNPSFDRDFLRLAAERAHINFPLSYRTVDLHSVCYLHMTKRGITPPIENKRSALGSTAIEQYVGIPEEPIPHNALMGAIVSAESLSRLLHDKPLLPEFSSFAIPWL